MRESIITAVCTPLTTSPFCGASLKKVLQRTVGECRVYVRVYVRKQGGVCGGRKNDPARKLHLDCCGLIAEFGSLVAKLLAQSLSIWYVCV